MKTPNGNPITIIKAKDSGLSSATYRAEYDPAVRAEAWYDVHTRLWTTYAIDENDSQVGAAEYSTNRAEAFLDLDYVIARSRSRSNWTA